MAIQTTKALNDFHTITPHLTVRGVTQAITYYCEAFGAAELYRNLAPDGEKIMHAELLLGDSRFLLHDEFPERDEVSPQNGNPTGVKLHLIVEDVDRMFASAVELGATVNMPVQDCFWGDRYGILTDPFGHRWSIATPIEDLSPGQLQKRAEAFKAENPAWPAESEKGVR